MVMIAMKTITFSEESVHRTQRLLFVAFKRVNGDIPTETDDSLSNTV